MLLNSQWVTEEIKKYLVTKEDENQSQRTEAGEKCQQEGFVRSQPAGGLGGILLM